MAALVVIVPVGLLLVPRAQVYFDYKDQSWTIAGTADGGRTLLVNLTPTFSSCVHGPKISVISQTTRAVQIRVQASDPPCGTLVARSLRGKVTLDRPLAGRAISGPLGQGVGRSEAYPLRMPDLTGLTPPVAAKLVNSYSLRPFAINGPRGPGAAVTAQSPAAGTIFPETWSAKRFLAVRGTLTTAPAAAPAAP